MGKWSSRKGLVDPTPAQEEEKKSLGYTGRWSSRKRVTEDVGSPTEETESTLSWANTAREGVMESLRGEEGTSPILARGIAQAMFMRESARNFPASAMRQVWDLVDVLSSPKQSAKALGELATGLIQKLTPGEQEYEHHVDVVVDDLKASYGDRRLLEETVRSDLAKVIGDITTAVIPAKVPVNILAKGGRLSTVKRIADATTTGMSALEPTTMIQKGMRFGFDTVVSQKRIHRLYQSAAKLQGIKLKKRRTVTQAALDNAIKLNMDGWDKLVGTISDIGESVDALAAAKTIQGQTTSIKTLLKGIGKLRKSVRYSTGDPISVKKALDKARKEIILANTELVGGRRVLKEMTPSEVNTFKKSLYAEVSSVYDNFKSSPLTKKQKVLIARNAMEWLEHIEPEIKRLNKKAAPLIELREAIEARIGNMANADLTDMGIAVRSAVGAKMGGQVGAAGGMALGILDKAAIKSRIAILLNSMQRKGIRISPTSTLIRLGLARLEDIEPDDYENEE